MAKDEKPIIIHKYSNSDHKLQGNEIIEIHYNESHLTDGDDKK
jgi:hypothetical protein